jgi:hypothetical protein
MYDFYANPPKNKADLREWLTSWLAPTPSATAFEHKGESFVQVAGFRRAFYLHGAFRNVATNEYAWWVVSDDQTENRTSFPTTRYPTYEAMLEGVINDYAVSWRLEVGGRIGVFKSPRL